MQRLCLSGYDTRIIFLSLGPSVYVSVFRPLCVSVSSCMIKFIFFPPVIYISVRFSLLSCYMSRIVCVFFSPLVLYICVRVCLSSHLSICFVCLYLFLSSYCLNLQDTTTASSWRRTKIDRSRGWAGVGGKCRRHNAMKTRLKSDPG